MKKYQVRPDTSNLENNLYESKMGKTQDFLNISMNTLRNKKVGQDEKGVAKSLTKILFSKQQGSKKQDDVDLKLRKRLLVLCQNHWKENLKEVCDVENIYEYNFTDSESISQKCNFTLFEQNISYEIYKIRC